MKKITCLISDGNLLEKVTSFCSSEKFVPEMISSPDDFEYDVATIIYLTDDPDALNPATLNGIPACLITDVKCQDNSIKTLPFTFDHIHLRFLVDAVIHNGCYEACIASVIPVSIAETFTVENDIFNVERIIFALTKKFVYFLDFQSLERVRVGLAEMLTNAIEHGNLNITGSEKLEATENGTYYDLVNERLLDRKCASRRVFFSYSINKDGMQLVMEDDGEGFDVNSLPDPTDPEGLLKLHGRGILITRMYFDEVLYNDKGNKVTLKKRF